MTNVPDEIYILEQDINNAFSVSRWRKTLLTEEKLYKHNETKYDFAWMHTSDDEDPNISHLKSASIEEFKVKASALDLPCYFDQTRFLTPDDEWAVVVAFKHEHLFKMKQIN